MKPVSRWLCKITLLLVAVLPLTTVPRAGAAIFTWNGGGANDNWGTAANWGGSGVPPKDGTADLHFDGTVRVNPVTDAPWAVHSLTFNPNSGGFGTTGSQLTIGAGGITNASAQFTGLSNNLSLSASQTWLISNANSAWSISGSVALGANTLTVDGLGATRIYGSISGSGGLVKNGTGSIQLYPESTPNTYTGPTVVNGGSIYLDATNAISGSGVTIGTAIGGANSAVVHLDTSNGMITNIPVTLNSSGLLELSYLSQQVGQLTFNGGNVTGYNDPIYGNGSLKLGAGVTSNASASMASISGNLNLNGNTNFVIAAGAAGATSGGADLEVSAVISNGAIIKSGTGVLRLSGANTFSSGVSVNAGTLALANDAALGTGDLTLNGGGLRADGGSRTVGNRTFISANFAVAAPATFGSTLTLNGQVLLSANTTVDVSGNLTIPNGIIDSGSNHSLTKNGNATLSLSGVSTFTGGLTVNAGNLALSGATIFGPVTLAAGSSATLANSTSAGLVNAASPTITGTFSTGGVFNTGSLTLPSATTLSSSGNIDNEGTTTLSSGTLTNGGGSAQILNNGQISGFGTVTSGSGGVLNNGTISLTSARQLQLNGGATQNAGTLALNGGTLTGTAALANTTGSVVGPGTITAALTNSGVIQPGAGTLNVAAAWTNSGLVELTGYTSNLTGGAITNTGSIQGLGSVGSAITNNGTIEAVGGTLALNGAVTNTAAGTLAAATGNKLLVTAGLPTNAGVVSLTGGTFDNNGRALVNTGQISGYGTLRTGGLTNANTTAAPATVTLTGGVTTVNGNVVNGTNTGNPSTANTGKISVLYNPVTFTGNVTNYGTFKTTATTVTFAGTFTNNGTFLSDPATQNFGNLLVGSAGALQGGHGDVFNVLGNLDNRSTQSVAFDLSAAQLTLSGGAAHDFAWAGLDLGANVTGLANNFAVGIFELGSGASVNLLGGTLYVHTLALDGGLGELANIVGNGHNIYYDLSNPANAYLNGATYALNGGGFVSPAPEPRVTLLLLLAALACGGGARRRKTSAI